ncbi:MAG: PDZ domain-containing protein [Firmicutes bacterium HGW-Firmicutes-12]|nr:MAG: PDZ domain-containing protein [Firmicutes bacterium HGW-Firmicutes-12]
MFSFSVLIPMMIETFLSLITDWIFWLIVILVAMQYQRIARSSQYLFKLPDITSWRPALLAVFFGLAGGLFGSILLIIVGISILELGIGYLWITAIILMLIRQRFLCFAYAGGVLSLSSLIFGFPDVSVAQLMGLVAILHMVESVLILFSGHLEAFPIYIRTKQGQVVGGYNLQKFWPLPLIALMALMMPEQEILKSAVAMPKWWPLIKPELLQGTGEPMYVLMPVVAALGYGDIAITTLPQDKTRMAALELAAYSLILLLLAITASYVPELAFVPALFGPLGHEFIIYIDQRRELQGEPMFVQPKHGVMILYALPKSPLKKARVRNGDIILSLNGYSVNNQYELRGILLETQGLIEIEYLSGKRRVLKKVIIETGTMEHPGFIAVPGGYEYSFMEISGSVSRLRPWWDKIRVRLSKFL